MALWEARKLQLWLRRRMLAAVRTLVRHVQPNWRPPATCHAGGRAAMAHCLSQETPTSPGEDVSVRIPGKGGETF